MSASHNGHLTVIPSARRLMASLRDMGYDTPSAIADLITGTGNDTLIGNDRDNKLMGGNGIDILVANGGNDTLIGGLGADKIYFGPGGSVARDTLGDLNGDTMFDFGFRASVDVLGSRIGRASIAITPTMVTVSADGSTFQLNGDFVRIALELLGAVFGELGDRGLRQHLALCPGEQITQGLDGPLFPRLLAAVRAEPQG